MPASISTIVVNAEKHCGHATAIAACSVHTAPSNAHPVNDLSQHARPYAWRTCGALVGAGGSRSRRHGLRLSAAVLDIPRVDRPGTRDIRDGPAFPRRAERLGISRRSLRRVCVRIGDLLLRWLAFSHWPR